MTGLHLNAAWFGIGHWCRLLGHACTIPSCPCDCHRWTAGGRAAHQ